MTAHVPSTAVETAQWMVTLQFNVFSDEVEPATEAPTYEQVARRAAERVEEWASSGYLANAVYRIEPDTIDAEYLDIDLEQLNRTD